MEHGGQSAAASEMLSSTQLQAVEHAISTHQHRPGALLPMLHAVQDTLGFVPAQAVPIIAEALNLSRAEVHGVVSFYHDFRRHPPGRHVLRLCRAEACQSMGAVRVAELVQRETGIGFGETTADGDLTLEAVYCLGNCACAPAAMLDGEVVGRLDEAGVRTLLRRPGGAK